MLQKLYCICILWY